MHSSQMAIPSNTSLEKMVVTVFFFGIVFRHFFVFIFFVWVTNGHSVQYVPRKLLFWRFHKFLFFLLLLSHFFRMSRLICSILIRALFCFSYFLPTSERICPMTPELKTVTPLSIFFVFWFAFLVFFDFLFCAFLGMSQLIRSILETCPFSCHTFWQLLGISFWSLDGHFWRPLSVEMVFFEFVLLLFFFLKTWFWRPLSHFRRF